MSWTGAVTPTPRSRETLSGSSCHDQPHHQHHQHQHHQPAPPAPPTSTTSTSPPAPPTSTSNRMRHNTLPFVYSFLSLLWWLSNLNNAAKRKSVRECVCASARAVLGSTMGACVRLWSHAFQTMPHQSRIHYRQWEAAPPDFGSLSRYSLLHVSIAGAGATSTWVSVLGDPRPQPQLGGIVPASLTASGLATAYTTDPATPSCARCHCVVPV